ncbi:hypothetical protein [Actinophytocola algeriensis]|uniref:Uncharacterized protein n=1 Tax=Actinophytocola algeriensis TaxID=1768010 RepID=A0A7W7Q3M7_9PSEU|nr:hypothetical protein [Actinophytocola algeriensis]MBB4906322.1 hypothetical protein [Actinophytocola algeriensis]MBE1477803.1 hypothetical protein [Actinophytocola algeriensis]
MPLDRHHEPVNQAVISRNTVCHAAIGSGPPTGDDMAAIPTAISTCATSTARWRRGYASGARAAATSRATQ